MAVDVVCEEGHQWMAKQTRDLVLFLGCPVVVLIFRSSRVVVTGAKKYDHVVSGFSSIVDTIRPFFVYH